jgi:hypothetical protein
MVYEMKKGSSGIGASYYFGRAGKFKRNRVEEVESFDDTIVVMDTTKGVWWHEAKTFISRA